MPQVIVSHQVADFTTWKAGFDAHEPKRLEHGIKTQAVYQGAVDPNLACMLFEIPSVETMASFMGDAEVQATLASAGVTSPPVAHIVNKV